jgi:hypothetical protein
MRNVCPRLLRAESGHLCRISHAGRPILSRAKSAGSRCAPWRQTRGADPWSPPGSGLGSVLFGRSGCRMETECRRRSGDLPAATLLRHEPGVVAVEHGATAQPCGLQVRCRGYVVLDPRGFESRWESGKVLRIHCRGDSIRGEALAEVVCAGQSIFGRAAEHCCSWLSVVSGGVLPMARGAVPRAWCWDALAGRRGDSISADMAG